MSINMTQDMPVDGDDNDTEIDITNTGEIVETLNITSNMTQTRPIDGDDNHTEKHITNAGEIIQKHNQKNMEEVFLKLTREKYEFK